MKRFSQVRLECRPPFDIAVTIDTGSDKDSVIIEQLLNNGTTTKFNTNLTIKLGSGDDFTSLDTGADDGATVVGKLTVDGGFDLDWLDLGTTVSLGVPLVQTGCETSI